VTPLVVDLDGDGFAEVVFATTSSSASLNLVFGELRAVDGRNGAEVFTVTSPQVTASFTPAVGDVDGDGRPEIVTMLATGDRLVCFEHDGTFKWQSAVVEGAGFGAACIADLNQDGAPEIVVGRQALDNQGNVLWTGTGTAGGTLAPAPHVADIDLDGMPEVIAGSTVYSATGTVEFTLGSTTDWFSAAANFDADPQAELVFVANSLPVLRNHDGTLIWGPGSLPTNGRGGAPTIADFAAPTAWCCGRGR
jgi:hypothetical protein